MAELARGTVLGGRFEIGGVLGRGGTATVYLATDRIRDQRIALKVLHPHLVHDQATRRRLRREVQAAAVLRHEAALVVWDLHEIDGQVALSMPLHRGQPLGEHVSARGRWSADALRSLALRLAGALAEAHRHGVIHRDLSPGNVLVDRDGVATLTDFGLARIAETAATRSTGVLGTAGYTAPEVYKGVRAEPRSDLYGLGAVLYLAATGRAPFEAPTPMATLQRQLAGDHLPLEEARPDLSPELLAVVGSMLAPDPALRPSGAREVIDALELRVVPEAPIPTTVVTQRLPTGTWRVEVRERPEDSGRREALRVDRGKAAASPASEVRRWVAAVVTNIRDVVGVSASRSPEEVLVADLAEIAGLPRDALHTPLPVLERRFVLVEGVDRGIADRLTAAARTAGFRAVAVDDVGMGPPPWARYLGPAMLALTVLGAVGLAEGVPPWIVPALLVGLAATWSATRTRSAEDPGHGLPVAFTADLGPWLTASYRMGPSPSAPREEAAASRGETLLRRCLASLDRVDAAVEELASELPDPAIHDLRATTAELRSSAERLRVDVVRLEGALADRGAPAEDASWIQGRLDRLHTLIEAGEPVDGREIQRLGAALAQLHAAEESADVLESQLTSCLAQLLEIAASADRVHRELVAREPRRGGAEGADAELLARRLRDETRAASGARREAQRRAARAAGDRHG